MRVVWLLLALAMLVPGSLAAEEPQSPTEVIDCARWSLKGLRVGMTLSDFKKQHPNAKHGRNWFRPDDRGRDWYFWPESRMHGVYDYVLPEPDKSEALILSIVAVIDLTDTTPADVIDSLVTRWGRPSARDVPVATVRYFTAFGVPQGQMDWKATTWEDDACDVLITALEQPRISPVNKSRFTTLTVSIDSITKLVKSADARHEAQRKKADEATRP